MMIRTIIGKLPAFAIFCKQTESKLKTMLSSQKIQINCVLYIFITSGLLSCCDIYKNYHVLDIIFLLHWF